ncbi:thioredoxin, mitochondrial [Tetranychus urticae]|uniref:Thioredoxin domain-containing protein n=1 Tax=Tetranychus urticae TaxID=32264 RepID=T1KH93_TETUR|nr:thioredoxin, mitochondrial [Tetranychus urticae]
MSVNLFYRFGPTLSKRLISSTACRLDIFTIQDENDFKSKVIDNKKPVIVDFYASWCNPCKQLTPRLETVIAGKSDKIDLAKVDVDNHEGLAGEYKVSSVPSIFAIKDGKVVDSFVGNIDDDKLRAFVHKLADN